MATVTGIGTLDPACPCCGCIHVGCCSLLGDTIISSVLTVVVEYIDTGTVLPYDCNFPAYIPFPSIRNFLRALYPIGGFGVAFYVTYVFDPFDPDFGKWVGSYTACDGTTVIVKYWIDSSFLEDCVWILDVYNPEYMTSIGHDPNETMASRLRHFNPGIGADGCDGYPFYWSTIIDHPVDVFPNTGLYATAYDNPEGEGEPCTDPPPLPTWDCVDDTDCVERDDGTGEFATLAVCEAECPPPPPVSYNCVDGTCVDPGDGTGTYATVEECIAAPCEPPESWDCVVDTCVDPGTGLGEFATLVECEAACPPTPPVTYDCVDDACVDPGTGLGEFASLELCEAECPPPPPVDCSEVPCLATNDVAWTDYDLTASGITDNGITVCHCSEINGSWVLTWDGTSQWETASCTTLADGCTCAVPSGPVWKLYCDSMTWKVADYLSGVIYVATTFNPLDGGDFAKTGSATFCDNLPATITLTPAGDPFQCE